MELTPTGLKVEQGSLVISWNDSTEQSIKITELRDRCPCANCRDRRSADSNESVGTSLPVLAIEQIQELKIDRMEPAGNYAYTIHFSDGHNNGLFTFEFLRSFAE